MFCAWSRTTVDGPVFIQSPENLMQCNKSWRVLFFNMWWKLESILTGRQLKTTHTLTIKHLEDYAAVKWKCLVQNRVDIYFPKKKGPQLIQEHLPKGNFCNWDKSCSVKCFFLESLVSVHIWTIQKALESFPWKIIQQFKLSRCIKTNHKDMPV